MERTPKSKFFSFSRSKKIRENRVKNWLDSGSEKNFISPNEVKDLENLPVITKDVLKTPEVDPESRLRGEKEYRDCGSPQFKVGWNDGSEKGNPEMDSPISTVPVQRRIRRCPDSVLHRASRPNSNASNEKKTDIDILQCVSWAKNLLESTRLDKDEDSNSNIGSTNTTNVVEDSAIDILDDSTNELMILCSQAVEESLPRPNCNVMGKHPITPDHGSTSEKRFKKNETPCSFNRNLTFDSEKKAKDDSILVLSCESNHRIRDFGYKNQSEGQSNGGNNVRSNTMLNCSINNNNNKTNNFNYQTSKKSNQNGLKSYQSMTAKNSVISKISSNTAHRDDPIKSLLEDEDDFSSLDFNFLDSLQTSISHPMPNPDVTICSSKPSVRYTKEQIEKRRMEAKKRLLFSKKHRSM